MYLSIEDRSCACIYDPSVGRFISEDPIGFESGDYNLYRYTSNNPVNLTDPLGNISGFALGAGVLLGGAAVFKISQLVTEARIKRAKDDALKNIQKNGVPNIPGLNLPMKGSGECPRGISSVSCFNPPPPKTDVNGCKKKK